MNYSGLGVPPPTKMIKNRHTAGHNRGTVRRGGFGLIEEKLSDTIPPEWISTRKPIDFSDPAICAGLGLERSIRFSRRERL